MCLLFIEQNYIFLKVGEETRDHPAVTGLTGPMLVLGCVETEDGCVETGVDRMLGLESTDGCVTV